MAKQETPVDFCLYVAGNSPNSRLAVSNLHAFCRQHLAGRHAIETVDVFEQPEKALADGVLLTPLLLIRSNAPPQQIVGNLSDTTVLLRALGLPTGESGP